MSRPFAIMWFWISYVGSSEAERQIVATLAKLTQELAQKKKEIKCLA